MIVIVIIGLLSTVALLAYRSSLEKARGAEARMVLGNMRSMCGGLFSRDGSTDSCTADNLLIGAGQGKVPGPAASQCRQSNFFWYNVSQATADRVTFVATRCVGAAGKQPGGDVPAQNLTLTINFSSGLDSWSGDY